VLPDYQNPASLVGELAAGFSNLGDLFLRKHVERVYLELEEHGRTTSRAVHELMKIKTSFRIGLAGEWEKRPTFRNRLQASTIKERGKHSCFDDWAVRHRWFS
jgi:hypothetical protein